MARERLSAFDAARERTVHALSQDGRLVDSGVRDALLAVPRERFTRDVPPEALYDLAQPVAPRTANGRTAPASTCVLLLVEMLQLAKLRPGLRVLEVGAGTGYNAALISHIVGREGQVETLEIDGEVATQARIALDEGGYSNAKVLAADGLLEPPTTGLYDRIVVSVGIPEILPWQIQRLSAQGLFFGIVKARGYLFDFAVRGCRQNDNETAIDLFRTMGTWQTAGSSATVPTGWFSERSVGLLCTRSLRESGNGTRSDPRDPNRLRDAAGAATL